MATEQDQKNLTYILYSFYIAAIFSVGILAIVALIINYVKYDSVRGTMLESHFKWQIRSFWWYLFWNVFALLCAFLIVFMYKSTWWVSMPFIAVMIIVVAWIWHVYRCVRGLITLTEDRPMYQP
ncbi:hypothetical protein BJI46_04525 [Acinetobacter qingfengensis]|uniref:Transmembrane protein n=2 Tax=Acinetobacter qingfengensis TaxID=1262585 RepID=A0A1E7R335_9GAMM|nr:hypothetical protein BJI46_04525 [Acinetobacter qingfengensis]